MGFGLQPLRFLYSSVILERCHPTPSISQAERYCAEHNDTGEPSLYGDTESDVADAVIHMPVPVLLFKDEKRSRRWKQKLKPEQ
jgi:hypothetical protein